MSFDIHDHVTNRAVSIRLSDMLDKTIGEAVRRATGAVGIPEEAGCQLARHAVIGAQASMDAIRGGRLNGFTYARSFITGEINTAVSDYFDQHGPAYSRHLGHHRNREEALEFLMATALRESISFASAYIGHVEKQHRHRWTR